MAIGRTCALVKAWHFVRRKLKRSIKIAKGMAKDMVRIITIPIGGTISGEVITTGAIHKAGISKVGTIKITRTIKASTVEINGEPTTTTNKTINPCNHTIRRWIKNSGYRRRYKETSNSIRAIE